MGIKDIGAIDTVVNIWTPESLTYRPAWRDGFFVEEISQVGFTARFGFPVHRPRSFVTGGYQDNVGFGFMTALGVKLANPRHAVVSVCGDGEIGRAHV